MEGVSMVDLDARPETLQTVDVTLEVNRQTWSGRVPVEEVLLDLLRSRMGLTGTKRACESEVCGACTVLVDGNPVSSCTHLAFEANGRAVTTVEGLATGDQLTPLQAAFIRHVAAQCGYCTPGQLMTATALLEHNPSPAYEEIAHWMNGNICRCGCYPAITAAILEAAQEMRQHTEA
jgi:aerobic-type carbon monoxide dehydrogenase small subunit (CoxS/CutS family)